MRPSKVIRRLVELAPPTIAPFMRCHGYCVAATRLGIDTLARFDIAAEPLPVTVRAINPAGVRWFDEGCPGGADEYHRRGGYMVSNDPAGGVFLPPTRPVIGPTWDGHLVVHVPTCDVMLDLDARQLARPERGLEVPSALCLPWDESAGHCELHLPTGTVVTYYTRRDPLTGRLDNAFVNAKDWRRDVTELVDRLERAVRRGR